MKPSEAGSVQESGFVLPLEQEEVSRGVRELGVRGEQPGSDFRGWGGDRAWKMTSGREKGAHLELLSPQPGQGGPQAAQRGCASSCSPVPPGDIPSLLLNNNTLFEARK